MNNNKTNVRFLAQLGLLAAIEIVMKLIGLGSVPVGPLYMSFLTVPIAVGAMTMGPAAGAILGAVFGLVSFKDALSGVGMTGVFFQISPLNTFVLCVVMRVLMGFCVGLIFKALRFVDRRGGWSYFIGALSAPLLNTLFFMGYIVLVFYHTEFIQSKVADLGAVNPLMFVVLLVGVQGLIVPNVKTLEQVHALVDYAKYYPIGQRGFCPSRKDGWGFDGLGSVPETMRHFNGETLLFPQCETAEALAIIEDICAVDGVDGIFVGPFDLSISMGIPGQFDAPEFQAAVARIVAACRAAGKYCMFFTGTTDGVVDGFRKGFDAMAYSLDAALFIQGVKRDVEDIRSRL